MEITLLKQDKLKNCGQTAVAMLTGKSIREVEGVYGHGMTTYGHEHVKAVNKLGFYADERGFQPHKKGDKLPEVALVRIVWRRTYRGRFAKSGSTTRFGHIVLWANGRFYDPAGWSAEDLQASQVIDKVLEVLAP